MARILALILAFALFAPVPAGAWHKRTPAVLQITPANSGPVQNPRWAGYRYVFFDSDADILGNGSQGGQIYYFDLQERDKTGLLAVHQLVNGGTPQRASTGIRGKLIGYDAVTPNTGVRDIYLVDRELRVPRALTRGSADSMNASMDDGSRFLVFESQADFFATGVPGTQIYRVDLGATDPACPYPCAANGNSGLTQITNKAGTSGKAVTSKSSKVIVFESDADLLQAGENETQIYRWDGRTATMTALSHGPGASHNPTMSRSAGHIAFESAADLTRAGTGGTQIFVYRQSTRELQQVTFGPGGQSSRPSMESNGRGVIFISTDDLVGSGSSGPEVFRYDLSRAILSQITNVAGITSDPAHSAGVFTTFLTDADLLGTGNSGTSLYLVNLFALGENTLP